MGKAQEIKKGVDAHLIERERKKGKNASRNVKFVRKTKNRDDIFPVLFRDLGRVRI